MTPSHTLEFECRSCGAKVTLHPQNQIAAERLMAYLLMPAIFPSLFFFARARRKTRAWTDNPVVGGLKHLPTAPPHRWCACSGAAPCVRIIQRRAGGLPIGTRHEYRCEACTRTFTVPDVTSLVVSFVSAIVLCGFGALIIVSPPGAAVGAEQSNQWFCLALVAFGLIAWLMLAFGIRARVNHPQVA